VLTDIETYLATRLDALKEDASPETAEVKFALIFAGLQFTSRLAAHGPQLQRASKTVAALSHPAAESDPWPDVSFGQDRHEVLEDKLIRELASGLASLPAQPHTGNEADLFGRAYHVLVDAAFRALITGRHDLAAEIFPVAMKAAFQARDRLITDLADQPALDLAVHGSAPLVDLMQISGYALFLRELDGDGAWPALRDAWAPVTSNPERIAGLAEVFAARQGLVPADMRRVRWQEQFDALLQARGLRRTIGARLHLSCPAPPHPSPVVTAFLAAGFSSPYEMADLFLIEYLATLPGVTDLKMSPQARRLREAIAAARQHPGDDSAESGRT
jgi:hypothetical protein